MTTPQYTPKDVKRFWSKVIKSNSPDGCWEWTATKSSGYGMFYLNGKYPLAHHFAYLLHHGAIPPDATFHHTCGNRGCVNPAHVYAETDLERFWACVQKSEDPDQCWEWIGYKSPNNYGHIAIRGVNYLSHRYSWIIHHGDIPDDLIVCHACDNPSCVNPAHLWLGTYADNSRDMAEKGRAARGIRNSKAKFTPVLVREIRKRYQTESISQRALAAEYGVTQRAIWQVIRRTTWKHI